METQIINSEDNSLVHCITESVCGFFDPIDPEHVTDTIVTYCIDTRVKKDDWVSDSLDDLDELEYYEFGEYLRIYQIIPYIDDNDELEDKVLKRQNIVLASRAKKQLLEMYKYLNSHRKILETLL